jgi:hypothetical protein
MPTIEEMLEIYERFTAAQGYIIGFHVGEDVYYKTFDRLPKEYLRIQKESRSNGGGYGLYIKIGQIEAVSLSFDAVYVGKLTDLFGSEGRYNRGVMFEKVIYETNGQEFRGKDNVPFYKKGDITIDGKEVQVKYEWARICYERTLRNLTK